MNTRVLAAAALLLSLGAVAGCSAPQASPPTETTTEPETVDITVELVDSIPLDLYANLDDVQCVGTYLGYDEVQVPEITIADGSGTILAVQDGPERGGSLVEGEGCTVPVEFEGVPLADVYVVEVSGVEGFTAERTVSGDDAETIVVEF